MNERLGLLLGQLDRLQGFFPRVEGRATFLFAAILAQLGILAVNFPLERPWTFTGAVSAVAVVFLSLTVWRIYGSLFPHLKPAPRPSLLYFVDVAGMNELDFVARAKNAHDAELLDDVASQIWRNSEILAIKFRRIREAFQFAAVALPLWLCALALIALETGRVPKLGLS